ncbi:transcription termination factor Rho [bacterium]|nr:transcription termination factor Rho [bacterium]
MAQTDFFTHEGILVPLPKGGGFIRNIDNPLERGDQDVFVPGEFFRDYGLYGGEFLSIEAETNEKGLIAVAVVTVAGIPLADYVKRSTFRALTAIDPAPRFELDKTSFIDMKTLDVVAPIGRGTRGLIVSPPKAGKTTILEHLAGAIREADPGVDILALLIDERPEEVTHFRRSVEARVWASSSDRSVEEHVALTELAIGYMKSQLEAGRHTVVLVDSLTRMARAFNSVQEGRGRVLSGGVEQGALDVPRRFFGTARNIEHGGSVTILATILIDTGSRMDQVVFEEFKGTGNSEVVLDRRLADQRVFPAIDIPASSTRKEEKLLDETRLQEAVQLRRDITKLDPKEAMEELLRRVRRI